MRLTNFAELELERLKRLMMRYEKLASDLPGIKLYSARDGNRMRYYITSPDNPKKAYIGWRKQETLLKRLLARKKAEELVAAIQQNIHAIEHLLGVWRPLTELFPEPDDEVGALRGKKAFPLSQNPYKKEELIHDTGLGFFTRSKSEAIVAQRLFAYGFWFKYEAPLRIRGIFGNWKTIYPDFTIYLEDGRIIYLEHVGKLQEEKYQKRFLRKILEYHKNDYLISRDVFITMDGPEGDIDIAAIDALIRTF